VQEDKKGTLAENGPRKSERKCKGKGLGDRKLVNYWKKKTTDIKFENIYWQGLGGSGCPAADEWRGGNVAESEAQRKPGKML